MTVANQVTLGRLLLAALFFGLLAGFRIDAAPARTWILEVCFWVFLIAALADVLDGWLARRMRQETSFGRVVDPVVDKVMICGAFVFFVSQQFYDPVSARNVTGVQPWMVVVILLRELLVSAIRLDSESRGQRFAAIWAGKVKMFVQSATVCVTLGGLAWFEPQLRGLRIACIWATVIVTSVSILFYLGRAGRFLRSREDRPLDQPPARCGPHPVHTPAGSEAAVAEARPVG